MFPVDNPKYTLVAGHEDQQGYLDGVGLDARFSRISGLCASVDGQSIYIADEDNHCLREFNISSNTVTTLIGKRGKGEEDGGLETAQLSYPCSVVALVGATVVIAERLRHSFRYFSLSTHQLSTQISPSLSLTNRPRLFALSNPTSFLFTSSSIPGAVSSLYARTIFGVECLLEKDEVHDFIHASDDILLIGAMGPPKGHVRTMQIKRAKGVVYYEDGQKTCPRKVHDSLDLDGDGADSIKDGFKNVLAFFPGYHTLFWNQKSSFGPDIMHVEHFAPKLPSLPSSVAGNNFQTSSFTVSTHNQASTPSAAAKAAFGSGFGSRSAASTSTGTFGSTSAAKAVASASTSSAAPTSTFGSGFDSRSAASTFGSTSAAKAVASASTSSAAPTSTFGSALAAKAVASASTSSAAPTSTFGSGFGSRSAASTFGSTSAAKAVASASTSSAAPTSTFGSTSAAKAAFGSPTPAFGSGFGARSSASSSTTSPTFGSGFGSRSAASTSIGAFGCNAAPASPVGPASGSGSFGSPTPAKTGFGSTFSAPTRTSVGFGAASSSGGAGFGAAPAASRSLPSLSAAKTVEFFPSLDFTKLLLTSTSTQLADLQIFNQPSQYEFHLHSGVLALRGIGSHPRIQDAQTCHSSRFGSISTKENDLQREKADARLAAFVSLLETSTRPISSLKLLISCFYNFFYSSHAPLSWSNDLTPSLPSDDFVFECVNLVYLALEMESTQISADPIYILWKKEVRTKVSVEMATKILHQLFGTFTEEQLEQVRRYYESTSPGGTVFCLMICQLTLIAQSSAATFDATLASEEDSTRPIGTKRLLMLSRLVNSPKKPVSDDQSHYLPGPIEVLWHAPSTAATAASAEVSTRSTSSDVDKSIEDEDVKYGKGVLETHGCKGSEFVFVIEGRRDTYVLVQSWLLFVRWSYFEKVVKANMSEMRTRVVVLPSDFPPIALVIIMRLLHGHKDLHMMKELRAEDEKFVLLHGVEFGLLSDTSTYPIKTEDVFTPLLCHIQNSTLPLISNDNCIRVMALAHECGLTGYYQQALSVAKQRWIPVADRGRADFVKLPPQAVNDLFQTLATMNSGRI